jgi:hypothetical protein
MMGSKTKHDSFSCPHSSEDWHDEALKLVQEYDKTASKRLKKLIQADINDLLDEHLPDGDYWSGK